jgi:hypothetical protein
LLLLQVSLLIRTYFSNANDTLLTGFCNFQPNPNQYCRTQLSDNANCNMTSGICECPANHFGSFCDYCEASVTCNSRGTCDENNGQCLCEPGYYAEVSEISRIISIIRSRSGNTKNNVHLNDSIEHRTALYLAIEPRHALIKVNVPQVALACVTQTSFRM